VHLFDIITQYKAVFSGQVDKTATTGRDGRPAAPTEGLLSGWVLQRVADFLEILDEHLPRLTDRFHTVLGQCMHFALSLGRVGLDFRPLLSPLFERTISDLFSSRVDFALSEFTEQIPTMALVAHATLPDASDGPDGLSSAPIAPLSLMAFPILARLTNNLLSALNDLRECAPLAVGPAVARSLSDALVAVSERLADYHALHRDTFDVRDKANFSGLAQMYVESLVPCVVRCVDAIYPEAAFQSGTQSITPPALLIDRVAIARPLIPFCSQAEAITLAGHGGGSGAAAPAGPAAPSDTTTAPPGGTTSPAPATATAPARSEAPADSKGAGSA
jgi:hypothetical protein